MYCKKEMTCNILICDDEPVVCEEIQKTLQNYAAKRGIAVNTKIFYTGGELTDHLSEQRDSDLLFLDIKLPDVEGVAIGSLLREKMQNNRIQIVFISSEQSYAMRLFEIRPFHFLIKPIEKKKLEEVFEKYYSLYQKEEGYLSYKKGKTVQKIRLSDIYYITCEGKKIHIITENGEETYNGTMRNIHGKYEEEGLWSVSYSEIINVRYVKAFRRDEVVMCDDYRAQISHRYQRGIRDRMYD